MRPTFLFSDTRDNRRWRVDLPPIRYERVDNIEKRVAELLVEEKVVGFFTGRSEFGPRALGNRSILTHARSARMQQILNDKVKHRQWFRPFAPAVLLEHAETYFALSGPSPHMLLVADVLEDKKDVIPAITHVDGTARVQTVAADTGAFRRVIEAYYELTGVPVILNTSFNDHGEPIVETPLDAFACFTATYMDALALGPYLILKEGSDG